MNDDLLPVVQTSIDETLLGLFFDDCRETRRILQQRVKTCEASGYSSLPVDRVRLGGTSKAV